MTRRGVLKYRYPHEIDDDDPQGGIDDHYIVYPESTATWTLQPQHTVEGLRQAAIDFLKSKPHVMYGEEYYRKFVSLRIEDITEVDIGEIDDCYRWTT